MPTYSLEALFRSLKKGELAPVYYFHGPEDVLKDEAVQAVVDRAVDPGLRDFNFDQRSAAQLDAEEIHALCNTLPMMAERRVVLLREIEGWKRKTRGRAEFLRYLERPSRDTVVILIQGSGEEGEDKELAESAYTVRFEPLPSDRARKWLLHHAAKVGVTFESEAAEHLVQSVGADLGSLASELAKLASLPAGEPLSVKQVAELVGVRHGETQWDWREAVLADQTAQAATLLSSVLAQAGVSGVKLVTLLGTALVGLGIARGHYDKGARGRALEDAVFTSLMRSRPSGLLGYKQEAQRWSHWAPRWPAERLRAALRAARDTDQALKSTTISDERELLTELVLRLGVPVSTDGEDARMTGARSKRERSLAGTALSVLAVFSALSFLFALPAFAQTDPRLVDVIRQAQEGRGDSARAKVQRLLAATSPTDTLYPQIIYTQAMVASDANEMRRQLQRVAVEHSSSSWADDALLRLVQLDYASGNLQGAARNLERIRLDYPGSSLLPQAAYWAARTYFDQKNPELACRWVTDGIAASRGNVELENQLGYLNQRCSNVRVETATGAAADSQPTLAAAGGDSTGGSPKPADSTLTSTAASPVPANPVPATPARPAPPPTTARPDSARPAAPSVAQQPRAPGGRFRIQITAVRVPSTAEATAAKLKARGFQPVIVQEAGLYKVRVGNYTSRPDAIAALPVVKAKLGGSPFVVAEP